MTSASNQNKKATYVSNSLKRGMTILEAFTPQRDTMTLSEIADTLEITSSAAYRVVFTLEQMGYLLKSGNEKTYRLSSRVMDLGYRYIKSQDVNEIAMPFVDELRDETSLSVHLGVLEGTDVVYTYRARSPLAMTTNVLIGSRLPAHATAMGRALLSALPETDIEERYQGYAFQSFSDETPVSCAELLKVLDEDHSNGYVINKSTYFVGTVALAAPLTNASGITVGAINLSGTERQLDAPEPFLKQLLDQATKISRYL